MLKSFIDENKKDVLFTSRSYRRMIYLAFFLLIVNFSLVAFIIYQRFTAKEPPNFATTTDGRLININLS